jgi:dolichyl-phosphate beta-glucosyltransferase
LTLDFTLILPAYNEAKVIAGTIAGAQSYLNQRGLSYEIIVSADGTDGSRERVRGLAQADPRLLVIGSPERRGKGHGVREAVFLARGEIVGFADADNKTPITELDKVWPWFEEGYDLVVGSRSLGTAQIMRRQPLYRRIGSMGVGYLIRNLTGLREIVDTQCGFKFFRRDVALDLFKRQQVDGYMFDVEILCLAEQANYRLKQVGVVWRDDGDSRLVLVGGNIQNFRDLLRLRSASWSRILAKRNKPEWR